MKARSLMTYIKAKTPRQIVTALQMACAVMCMTAAVGCSHIDEDERLIYVKPPEVSRAVLIEDFTGQRCSNCPTATELIETLVSQYGDSAIIPVAIHSGPLGFAGNAKYEGLMTDLGNTYYNYWNIDRQPMGVIDRSGGAMDYDKWTTKVNEELALTTPVSIKIDCEYNSESQTIEAKVEVFSSESINANLQVWLTEDSIVSIQTMPDGHNEFAYVHNHVLRESLNGDWGDELSLAEAETVTKTYTLDISSSKYNAGNLSIVAFVYDSNGVKQAAKRSL